MGIRRSANAIVTAWYTVSPASTVPVPFLLYRNLVDQFGSGNQDDRMIISSIVLLGAMLLGAPIAFAIALSALGYFWTTNANLLVLPQQFIGQLGNIPLIAIPFFILAGEL